MKKIKLQRFFVYSVLFIAFTIFGGFTVFAQNWSSNDGSSNSKTVLTNKEGITASVTSDSSSFSLGGNDLQSLSTILDTICSIPELSVSNILVYVNEFSNYGADNSDSGGNVSAADVSIPRYRITVIPASISYKNNDLKPLLPSGLAFYYDSSLFYDVTVKAGDLLPRVTGAYISPADMLSRIVNASTDPDRYMYDTALLNRIERLESALMAVSKKSLFSSKLLPVEQQVVEQIMSLYNEKPGMTRADVIAGLKDKGLKVSNADVNAVLMVYFGIYE